MELGCARLGTFTIVATAARTQPIDGNHLLLLLQADSLPLVWTAATAHNEVWLLLPTSSRNYRAVVTAVNAAASVNLVNADLGATKFSAIYPGSTARIVSAAILQHSPGNIPSYLVDLEASGRLSQVI